MNCPAKFTAWLEAGIDFLPRPRVLRRRINLAGQLNLWRRQTIGGIVVLAQKCCRIELASRWVANQSVLKSVERFTLA